MPTPLSRTTRRGFVAALGATLLAGCYGQGKNAPDPVARTTVRVVNQGFLDRTIYVMRGSERIRLGIVSGNSTQVLNIPTSVVQSSQSLRFVADPIGGRGRSTTEEVSVSPGDQVLLTIPPG
jgi:hypothetical protein